MRALLFLLSIIYSFIFYVFYQFSLNKNIFGQEFFNKKYIGNISIFEVGKFFPENKNFFYSLSGNLLIESFIFLFIGIIFIYYFSYSVKKKEKFVEEYEEEYEEIEEYEEKNNFSIEIIKQKIIEFMSKYSKYIGLIFFYFSLYLFSIYLDLNFSYFQAIIGVLIFGLYFLFKKNDFFVEFFYINSILFSFYYIINYIIIFFSGINYLKFIDFFNAILIIFSFIILFKHYKESGQKKIKNIIFVYFVVYLFFLSIFYIYMYFTGARVLYLLSILSILFSIILFDIFPKISFLNINIYTSRLISILFLYFGIFSSFLYLILYNFSLIIFIGLIISYFFNLYIHYKFQNYISFIISIITGNFLVYYTFFHIDIVYFKDISFLILGILFSSFLIFITYIYNFKYIYDYYVVHFYAYLINLFSVIIYFVFNDFSLLYTSAILFVESIFFFSSFNKLKNLGKYGKTKN